MKILRLAVQNLRCFDSLALEPGPGLNVFVGDNGSGKSSLLEGVFLLGRGHSFRSSRVDEAIRRDQAGISVRGDVEDDDGIVRRVILKKQRGKSRLESHIGASKESVTRRELAQTVPLLLLNSDSFRLIEEGPKFRRRFFDWGVFHVEHRFIDVWRRYQHALEQRNALLRTHSSPSLLEPWDSVLVSEGNELDAIRQRVFEALLPHLTVATSELLSGMELKISYRRGWSQDQELKTALVESLEVDRRMRFTGSGPHAFDVTVQASGRSARSLLSRGQEKLLLTCMAIAVANLVLQERQIACGILADDLPAELDPTNLSKVISAMGRCGYQSFITATSLSFLPELPEGTKVFHVKHEGVEPMV